MWTYIMIINKSEIKINIFYPVFQVRWVESLIWLIQSKNADFRFPVEPLAAKQNVKKASKLENNTSIRLLFKQFD